MDLGPRDCGNTGLRRVESEVKKHIRTILATTEMSLDSWPLVREGFVANSGALEFQLGLCSSSVLGLML